MKTSTPPPTSSSSSRYFPISSNCCSFKLFVILALFFLPSLMLSPPSTAISYRLPGTYPSSSSSSSSYTYTPIYTNRPNNNYSTVGNNDNNYSSITTPTYYSSTPTTGVSSGGSSPNRYSSPSSLPTTTTRSSRVTSSSPTVVSSSYPTSSSSTTRRSSPSTSLSYDPYAEPDIGEFPNSPYHRYAYESDPFSNEYSTHSRLEEYGAMFNNRYFHNLKIPPGENYETYRNRKRDTDSAVPQWESEEDEPVGLLEGRSGRIGIIGRTVNRSNNRYSSSSSNRVVSNSRYSNRY
eukprot:GHVS01095684.1.p1 GENE.GHVS01095684.1~~GHVS01095684.1.p1  ORF type:complete len:292 (+),score=56.79 GHVS01095684.1:352-1227(+)